MYYINEVDHADNTYDRGEKETDVSARRMETQGKDATVVVTRRGKPVLAIMSWEFFEALDETIEIMGDEELMKSLRQSIKEAREGNTVPWEDAKRALKS